MCDQSLKRNRVHEICVARDGRWLFVRVDDCTSL